MSQRIDVAQFNERFTLPDWRCVLGRLEARFAAESFSAASRFVLDVAELADQLDHHPDVDLRYPGIVQVALSTHGVGGLTELDAELAERISLAATALDLRSDPMAARAIEIAIDAIDIAAVRPFWRAALAYVDGSAGPGEPPNVLVDPRRLGPPLWFQQMDEPRHQRNRIHLDISVPHDLAEQRVADVLAAGGRLVSDARARAFWVLADPEGNEACICTWQDR